MLSSALRGRSLTWFGSLWLMALLSGGAHGDMIPITNPSFESPALADGSAVVFPTSGWIADPGAIGVGVFNPPATAYNQAGIPDGVNIAFANVGTFSQLLSANLGVGIYTLAVFVGDRLDNILPNSVVMDLVAGSTVLTPVDVFTPSTIDGEFVLWTKVYEINAGDPLLGQALTIRLGSGAQDIGSWNGGQVGFDNVTLSSSVPAPPGVVLSLAGVFTIVVGGLMRRARRRIDVFWNSIPTGRRLCATASCRSPYHPAILASSDTHP